MANKPFENYTHDGSQVHKVKVQADADHFTVYPNPAPFNLVAMQFQTAKGILSDEIFLAGTMVIKFKEPMKFFTIRNIAIGNNVNVAYSNSIETMFVY